MIVVVMEMPLRVVVGDMFEVVKSVEVVQGGE